MLKVIKYSARASQNIKTSFRVTLHKSELENTTAREIKNGHQDSRQVLGMRDRCARVQRIQSSRVNKHRTRTVLGIKKTRARVVFTNFAAYARLPWHRNDFEDDVVDKSWAASEST